MLLNILECQDINTTKNYQAQNSNSAQAQVGKLLSTVVSDGLGILNANANEGVLGTIKMFYILFVVVICFPKFTTLYTSNGHILLYAILPQS